MVEDDDIDVMAVQRTFKKEKIANPLHIARDGVEALDFLRGTGGKPKLAKPYVILLDINMPRMDGHEFLCELRSDPEHKNAVVFVLTTSSAARDREAAYERHVAGYITKRDTADGFVSRVTRMLDGYWRVVQLPS